MTQDISGPVARFMQQFSDYLPTLTAGVFLVGVGFVAGWLAKRGTVRVLVWLRLDRLGQRSGWPGAFGKGDVRAPLYALLGNGAWLLVTLVFLDNALRIWGLEVLADMVERVLFFVPNILVALFVVGVGVLVAGSVATRVEQALDEEGFPRARLVAGALQSTLVTVVGALALWQLNFAREIVYAAFLIGFGAVGVAFAVAVGLGTARAVQTGWESIFRKKRDGEDSDGAHRRS
jgi:hypothetical protein